MVMNTEKKLTVDDKEFWEAFYRANKLVWDIGQPAPPLVSFLKSPYAVLPGSMAVLGCGTGHDAMLFIQRGFQVTGIDFAPSAIQSTYGKFLEAGVAGNLGFLLERDFFDLHEYAGYFDYVLEHNFFSSIHPSRRRLYAHLVRDLLKPGGKVIGLWWVGDQRGGPPFAIQRDELHTIFGDMFTFDLVFTPADSVPQRLGNELFSLMTRK